ncbi:hypothetical protein J6590_047272 [Homalodisca vitripennis]|nr:hypothetical protein J6590_047272 [Homalodisca vitripennis]
MQNSWWNCAVGCEISEIGANAIQSWTRSRERLGGKSEACPGTMSVAVGGTVQLARDRRKCNPELEKEQREARGQKRGLPWDNERSGWRNCAVGCEISEIGGNAIQT